MKRSKKKSADDAPRARRCSARLAKRASLKKPEVMKIQNLLNPDDGSESRPSLPLSRTQAPAAAPAKRQKLPKDAANFNENQKVKDIVNYPPYEAGNDRELAAHHRDFRMYPMGELLQRGVATRPYSSEKKSFENNTGRKSFEMFQYVYYHPTLNPEKEWTVVWDYQVGLVRMTPFFKSLGHPKTVPAKALKETPGLMDLCYSITGGSLLCQGYWVPYQAAKALAATFCYNIRWALTPVFGNDFPAMCIPPTDPGYQKYLISSDIVRFCTQETERFRRLGDKYRIRPSIVQLGAATTTTAASTISFTIPGPVPVPASAPVPAPASAGTNDKKRKRKPNRTSSPPPRLHFGTPVWDKSSSYPSPTTGATTTSTPTTAKSLTYPQDNAAAAAALTTTNGRVDPLYNPAASTSSGFGSSVAPTAPHTHSYISPQVSPRSTLSWTPINAPRPPPLPPLPLHHHHHHHHASSSAYPSASPASSAFLHTPTTSEFAASPPLPALPYTSQQLPALARSGIQAMSKNVFCGAKKGGRGVRLPSLSHILSATDNDDNAADEEEEMEINVPGRRHSHRRRRLGDVTDAFSTRREELARGKRTFGASPSSSEEPGKVLFDAVAAAWDEDSYDDDGEDEDENEGRQKRLHTRREMDAAEIILRLRDEDSGRSAGTGRGRKRRG